jgi:hypothetical protein
MNNLSQKKIEKTGKVCLECLEKLLKTSDLIKCDGFKDTPILITRKNIINDEHWK